MIYLHNMDCMEAMAQMPDNAFDLAIVDPPYGLGMAKSFAINGKKNCKYWKKYAPKNWDNNKPSKKYFDELLRVSKHQIIWGGNYFIDNLYPSMGWICWNKGQRNFTLADGELAWTSFNCALRIFDFARPQARASNRKSGAMFHPTKKPIELYNFCLNKYAKKGWRILDTHLGSGSSAIAAYNAGYEFHGYEIDTDYYNAAKKRFENHKRQLRMFV
jgi:site-specific DNA-methyltransferase (adenine-specific)